MAKWTAVQYDLSKQLHEVHPTRVKIPDGINLELIVDLDDETFGRLKKDAVWGHRIQEAASAKAQTLIAALKAKVKDVDEKAAKFDVKTVQIFTDDINAFIKQKMEAAGHEMAHETDKFLEDYHKGQKDLTKFRVKSGAKIGLNSVAIVGAVAVVGATHGALAPAGIVAIARSGIVIAQETAKLATTADQIALLIKGELAILKKIMIEDLEKAKTAGKIAQSVKEAGLGVLSGVLGIEIPNLKNCQAHIEVHKVDIAKLEGESHGLGKTVHDIMDATHAWEAKFTAAKKTLPVNKVAKVAEKQKKAEAALHDLLDSIHKINEAINRANARQILFENTLNAMKKGVPEWVGYIQTVTTLAVDIGLAIGGAASVAEGALAVIIACEVDIGSELADHA